MAGKAALAHAQYSKEVAVAEAKARQESAVYDKQAEITRAEAVAAANKIIGDSLKNNEDYLKYLWITDTVGKNVDKTVVYIPTVGNIPIMEAGRTPAK
jgi:regulator of protease activity HflC (stomatin/prohibitin superfamily)